MAKRAPQSDPAQEEELVVTVVRFKGSGETARKGIDAVSQALAAAFGAPPNVVKSVNGRKTTTQLTAGSQDTVDSEPVDDTDEEAQEEQEPAQSAPAKGTSKPRKLPKFDSSLM